MKTPGCKATQPIFHDDDESKMEKEQ